ncbi:MAG: MFS transporter [Nocardioidaceae bacterium]
MAVPPARRDPVVLALVSHALGSVGMSLPWPLLLVLVWESTHSEVLLGVTGASRMAPYVLLSWAAGRTADRWPRDRVIRATLTGRCVALAVAAAGVAGGDLRVAVAASAVAVALATPAYPALAAALPLTDADPRSRLGSGRATELLVTIEVASFVVGPALGGLLLLPHLRGWVFPAALVMVALGFAAVATLRLPAVGSVDREAAPPVLAEIRRDGLVGTIVVMSLVNLVVALLALALVPLAEGLWRGGAAAYGVATSCLGFGALAGPLVAGFLGGPGRGPQRLMGRGLALVGLLLVAVSLAPALGWAVGPLALIGAVTVRVEAAATALLQERLPNAVCASVLGLTDTVMVGAALVGSLAGPVLVGVVGPLPVLLGLACVVVAAAATTRKPTRINTIETESVEQPLANSRIAH